MIALACTYDSASLIIFSLEQYTSSSYESNTRIVSARLHCALSEGETKKERNAELFNQLILINTETRRTQRLCALIKASLAICSLPPSLCFNYKSRFLSLSLFPSLTLSHSDLTSLFSSPVALAPNHVITNNNNRSPLSSDRKNRLGDL